MQRIKLIMLSLLKVLAVMGIGVCVGACTMFILCYKGGIVTIFIVTLLLVLFGNSIKNFVEK